MSLRYYANAPATTLAASCTNSATSIQVSSVTGFPIQYPFTLIIDRGTASEEAVSVTAAAGTTLTVTRGFDSTTAFSHSTGATVEHGITAQDIRESNTHTNSTSGVHGVAGSVVGTSDSQAITNKDLSSPTNTFPSSLATDAEVSAAQAAAEATAAAALSAHQADTSTHGVGEVVGRTEAQALSNKDLTSTTNSFPSFLAPVGVVLPYAGATAPTGYLLCDGTAVSRTTYAALFALVGTTYGAGDGSTTFNLPNLKGKVPVGKDAAQAEFDTLGETGGEKTHTLTTSEMPSHSHGGGTSTNGDHTHGIWKSAGSGGSDGIQVITSSGAPSSWGGVVQNAGNHSHSISTEGGGGAHNNLQPYIALNYIIRAA